MCLVMMRMDLWQRRHSKGAAWQDALNAMDAQACGLTTAQIIAMTSIAHAAPNAPRIKVLMIGQRMSEMSRLLCWITKHDWFPIPNPWGWKCQRCGKFRKEEL